MGRAGSDGALLAVLAVGTLLIVNYTGDRLNLAWPGSRAQAEASLRCRSPGLTVPSPS